MTRSWLLLGCAVILEVFGFYALTESDGLTRVTPTVLVVGTFSAVFWLLARVMKRLPLGIAYALWSGCTTLLTSLMDFVVFGQQLSFGQVLGICLIVAGASWLQLGLSGSSGKDEKSPQGSP